MALFQIDEEQKLKKALNAGIKKGNLKIIGGVLAVLVLIIVFTMVDFGNLFKGQLDLQSCGQSTEANYLSCVAEKAAAGSCEDISDAAGGTLVGAELYKATMTAEQISKMNQLTDVLIAKYKEKACEVGFLSNYSSQELTDYKNYCYPGSFFAYKQTNTLGKILNTCLPMPDGPFMAMLTKKYDDDPATKKQWEDFYTAMFETIYKQSNINLNDLTFLTELKTDADANYKTLAYTKTLIENIIIEKFTCKEGPAYIPDPENAGQCKLSCDNALSEISKASISYYIALQQGKPAAEKVGYLKTVSDLIKQSQTNSCYAGKFDEVQKLCSSFNNYQYGLGLSSEENTLLPDVTKDLKCCSAPGQSLETGACAYKDLKFQEDLISSLALYKYALVQNSTDAEKLKAATRLRTTLDAYKAQFEALSLSKLAENKEVAYTCADTLEILNSNKIPANDKALTDALTNSSKLLQCCPEPGYYKLVSDPTNGEKPVYSCAVPTDEFKEFQLEQKQCYASPTLAPEIAKVFVMGEVLINQTVADSSKDMTINAPYSLSCSDEKYKDLQACQGTPAPKKISCTQIKEAWKNDATTYEGAKNFCNVPISSSSSGTDVTGNNVGDCKNDPMNPGCQTKNVDCPDVKQYGYWWLTENPDEQVYCGNYDELLNCSVFPDAPGCTFDCTQYPSVKACPQTASGSVIITYPEYAYCSNFSNIPLCKSDKPAAIYCSEHQEIVACQKFAAEGSSIKEVPTQVIKPLYDGLKAKQDKAIEDFLKAVQDLDTTTKNSCKLTELSEKVTICGEIRNTLSAAQYKPADYSDSIKSSLNTLANETLRCCYYEYDGNTDLEINFNTSSDATGFALTDFACSSKTLKGPSIKSQTIDKTTFNPTALEKLKITYTIDAGATVTISIADIIGTEVYKFDDVNVAAQALTSHFWDGKANAGTNTGKIVNNGTYSYSLKAKNSAGDSAAVGGAFAVTGSAATTQPPVTQPPQVIPQAGVKCTDNDLADNSTKICISGEWILCTEGGQYDGQKSIDKKLTCAGGKWIDLSNPPPPTPKTEDKDPPCVENNTMMEGKRICKGGEWITCVPNLEGKKSSDGQKECRNGIWQKAGVTPPGTTPPGGDQGSGNLKISKHSAFPVGFNPLINETKITYEISAKAEVEIRILTQSGVTITTLVDNKVLDKGEYFVWWDGTNSANGNGKVVDPATYQYKITAKDPNNGTVKDVKTGNINVVYIKSADFENGSGNPVTVPPVNNQAQATVAMQGATGGKTAGTGPGILIYALFPLGGYFISRYKKK